MGPNNHSKENENRDGVHMPEKTVSYKLLNERRESVYVEVGDKEMKVADAELEHKQPYDPGLGGTNQSATRRSCLVASHRPILAAGTFKAASSSVLPKREEEGYCFRKQTSRITTLLVNS